MIGFDNFFILDISRIYIILLNGYSFVLVQKITQVIFLHLFLIIIIIIVNWDVSTLTLYHHQPKIIFYL